MSTLTIKQVQNRLKDVKRHHQLIINLYELWIENTDSVYIPKLLDYVVENNILQIHFDGNADVERKAELLYKIFSGEIKSRNITDEEL